MEQPKEQPRTMVSDEESTPEKLDIIEVPVRPLSKIKEPAKMLQSIDEVKQPAKAMPKAKLLESEREVIIKKKRKANLTARGRSKKDNIAANRAFLKRNESQDIGEKTI